VELAERGEVDSPRVRQVLLGCLTPMLDSHADALVLGCTHYPFFRPAIEALVGERMRVFDTGEPVARQTRHVLESGGLLAPESRRGNSVFYSTSSAASLREVGSKLLCVDLDAYDARWSNSDLHALAPDAPK